MPLKAPFLQNEPWSIPQPWLRADLQKEVDLGRRVMRSASEAPKKFRADRLFPARLQGPARVGAGPEHSVHIRRIGASDPASLGRMITSATIQEMCIIVRSFCFNSSRLDRTSDNTAIPSDKRTFLSRKILGATVQVIKQCQLLTQQALPPATGRTGPSRGTCDNSRLNQTSTRSRNPYYRRAASSPLIS